MGFRSAALTLATSDLSAEYRVTIVEAPSAAIVTVRGPGGRVAAAETEGDDTGAVAPLEALVVDTGGPPVGAGWQLASTVTSANPDAARAARLTLRTLV